MSKAPPVPDTQVDDDQDLHPAPVDEAKPPEVSAPSGGAVGIVQGAVQGAVQGGIDGVRQTTQWASQSLDDARKRVDSIVDAGKTLAQEVKQSIDIKRQLQALSHGDSYILELGASGSAEGTKLYGQGQITAKRMGEGYLLCADGDFGGGLFREIGGRIGTWKLGASVELLIGAGVGVEMLFQTPEEAHQTIVLLTRLSTLSTVGKVLDRLPFANRIFPEHIRDIFRLSGEERLFLQNRASAYLFRGQIVPELALALGVARQHTSVAGVFAQGQNKEQITARIERGSDGQPQTLELVIEGGLRVSWGGAQDESHDQAITAPRGPGHRGVIALHQRFSIPEEWSTIRETEGLFGAIRKLGKEISNTKQDQLRLTYDTSSGGESPTRLQTELRLIGDWGELISKDLLRLGEKGKLEEILTSAGGKLRLQASMSPYAMRGLQLTPSIGVMGIGAAVNVRASREEMLDDPRWTLEGDAADIAKELSTKLRAGLAWFRKTEPEAPEVTE